ncbi:unnamed protein product, partial [Didymodactylos carnosus]
GLSILNLECKEELKCENNMTVHGDNRCQTVSRYILQTVDNDLVHVKQKLRHINVTLPKLYPFAGDKDLVASLEQQAYEQQQQQINQNKQNFGKLHLSSRIGTTSLVFAGVAFLVLVVIVIVLVYRRKKNSFPTVQLTTIQQPSVTVDFLSVANSWTSKNKALWGK